LSAERISLKSDEDREVKRILRRLSAEVGRVAKPLTYAIDILARLDLLTAKARYSHEYRMTVPEINTEGRLWLRDARHPVLEHLFRNSTSSPTRTVVPIEVRLGIGFNMLIITGPNTGGKTVTLKTTGLLAVMALSGMPIPAGDGCTVPELDHILADIGDEQSLEQSLSTFSSHISRIAGILKVATERSLILLDELGAGTDPTEGAALGRAILDELDQIRCRAIVTTHLGDLKTYALNNDRAENGAVEFSIETLRPTYRLHIGQFGMSNALKIARRLKLPKELLARAHKYLRRRKGKAPELTRLQQLREEAEKARLAALAAQHDAEEQKRDYERKIREFEKQVEEQAELHEQRAALQPNMKVRVSRFDAVGRVVKVDSRKKTVVVSLGLGQWEVPFEEVFPEES
jgi:DNA mismatch repair protein MutS2